MNVIASGRSLVIGTGAAACIFVVGCGHPATKEDCDRIIDKTAELKLKEENVTDPSVIEKQIAGYKEQYGDDVMQKCLGKTITRQALDCVTHAESSDAVDKCLY
jgi:hypothetical protein